MKKIVFTTLLSITSIFFYAQKSQYGIKGGLNYNYSGDLTELNQLSSDIVYGAEKSVGYHAGLWLQLNYTDIFLRGETLYTQFKTDFAGTPNYTITTKKIDVPILVGVKVIGPLYIFAGPDFQYILQEDFSLNNTQVSYDDFTVGLNLGVGIDLGKLSFDVRWDRGLSGADSEILNSEFVTQNFTLDNRPNQLVLSLNIDLSGK